MNRISNNKTIQGLPLILIGLILFSGCKEQKTLRSAILLNGTNFAYIEKSNEEKFYKWSERIHYELLRRVKAAVKK